MTYILWSSDFSLYLEDNLMYEHHFFGDYESVLCDIWPKNNCMSLRPIFHGPVILCYLEDELIYEQHTSGLCVSMTRHLTLN